MKIKKLYAEPEMKLHKLSTSRIMAGSDPYESININPGSKEGEDFEDEVGGGD
jgi:hypothetical protein